MTETIYQSDQLTVTATFTNQATMTAEQFRAAIESALGSVANNLQGEIVVTIGNGSTGVILGNG